VKAGSHRGCETGVGEESRRWGPAAATFRLHCGHTADGLRVMMCSRRSCGGLSRGAQVAGRGGGHRQGKDHGGNGETRGDRNLVCSPWVGRLGSAVASVCDRIVAVRHWVVSRREGWCEGVTPIGRAGRRAGGEHPTFRSSFRRDTAWQVGGT